MSTRTRGLLLSALGLLIAVGLGWTWWRDHPVRLGPGATPALTIGALACLCMAIWMQLLRTSLLLRTPVRKLLRPLLLAHGMNIWLPSMMGDLFEVWAVAKVAGRSKRGTLVLLGHRFAGTLSALGLLAAVALAGIFPSVAVLLGAGAIGGYLLVDQTVHRWVVWLRMGTDAPAPRPLGPRVTLMHLGLAVLQHSVEAAGIFILGISLGAPISPGAAMGMVSMIEVLTYLPIPLGSAGANHWGASTILAVLGAGGPTAVLVAGAHGLHLGLGALAIGIGSIGADGDRSTTA